MNLFAWIEDLRRERNTQMAWGRIAPDHVLGAPRPAPFKVNDDYVIVRLGSMFIAQNRVLWLKLSPLLHAAVSMKGSKAQRDETPVIGPAQFGDLAAAPADRSVVLNQRLAGPAVWRGGDLNIAAGLFAVPKDQAAAALLSTLSQLSGLGGIPGLKEALQIANIVKSGVEGLIGLAGTRPVLGVKDALSDTSGAGPCVLAGLAAPAAAVDFSTLWVRDGRLYAGAGVGQLSPLQTFDHVLIAVERGQPRQDWRGLPSLTPHEGRFAEALRASGADAAEIGKRLNQAFRAFDADLGTEEDLTDSDKSRIRAEVAADLKARLARIADPLGLGAQAIETRSIGGVAARRERDAVFDFLDVGALPAGVAPALATGIDPF